MSQQGARDPFNIMYNCRRLLADKMSRCTKNWVLACELFAVGGTSGVAICREVGIDPDGYEVRKIPPPSEA